jgi:hypothetical protein
LHLLASDIVWSLAFTPDSTTLISRSWDNQSVRETMNRFGFIVSRCGHHLPAVLWN